MAIDIEDFQYSKQACPDTLKLYNESTIERGIRMTKSVQKTAAVMLTAAMLTALAACSSGNNKPDPGDSAEPTTASGESFDATKLTQYDPPITLTTVRQVGPDVKYKNGESLDNNVFTKWLKDKMGINIKTLWTTPSTNDAYQTKLMLTLSAGEQLPDYLTVPAEFVQNLIDSGKFRAVDDLFEQYASDKWKNALAEVPNVWLPYKRDGKAYALPMIESSLLHDDVMFIRQDWLDSLQLQAPTTLEELEVVMEAFVHDDPDGNGVDDTIAVAASGKKVEYNYTSWLGLNGIYGALGAYMSIWHKKDGEIVYGSTTPEAKTALQLTMDWIDKGYLHKEFGIHDEVKAIELFTSGKAGIAFAASWAYDWPFNEVEKNVEGAKVWAYPLPSGPNGTLGQIGNALNHWLVTLINKDMKHPEALFMYQNYMYEHYEDPAAGSEFEHGFAKGYDWDLVDGKVVTSDSEIPGGRVDPQLMFLKPVTPSKHIKTLAELADGKQPETPYEVKLSNTQPVTMEAAKHVYAQREHTVVNLYTSAPTETMKSSQEFLNKLEAEMFSKIIYGYEPLDAFDKWVENWKKQGGEKITQEVKDWYAEVGGQ